MKETGIIRYPICPKWQVWNEIKGVCEFLCEDSDGGINLDIKGFTSNPITNEIYNDSCNPDGDVIEYFCNFEDKNRINGKLHKCESLNQGKLCRDGACIGCTDTDGGLNYHEKGETAGKSAEVDYLTGGDTCYKGEYNDFYNNGDLVEHYCDENGLHTNLAYDCGDEGRVCVEGACVLSESLSTTYLKRSEESKKITIVYLPSNFDSDFISDFALKTFGENNPTGLIDFYPFSEYANHFEIISLNYNQEDYSKEEVVNSLMSDLSRTYLVLVYLNETCVIPTASIEPLQSYNEIFMSICQDNIEIPDYFTYDLPRAFVHEFGHAFGLLADEYAINLIVNFIEAPNLDSEGCSKWCEGTLNENSANYGDYQNLKHNCIEPYTNELGLLYFSDDSIRKEFETCLIDYPNFFNWDLGKNCIGDSGCFLSAGGFLEWRSYENTMMRSFNDEGASFGEISEQQIQNRFSYFLGS